MYTLKTVLVKDLNRDHLRSKKRGIENPTVGWLISIAGEEDDHLFNERQSRETVRHASADVCVEPPPHFCEII
jgi:hypothetical protein